MMSPRLILPFCAVALVATTLPHARGAPPNPIESSTDVCSTDAPSAPAPLNDERSADDSSTDAASGSTRFILFGGGTSPFNTQASIEEHLIRFRRLLEPRAESPDLLTVLFAHGRTGDPVVEVLEPLSNDTLLLRELALFMDQTNNRTVTWRPTHFDTIDGEASRAKLQHAIEVYGTSSRSFLYFAGHGYQSAKTSDVTLGLWDRERVSPRDLARWLDRLPPDHRVITVLTQCHAGGFGEYVYKNGDQTAGFTDRDRCGFYAAPADFVSSGCTPAANRPDPDDYSTWFISALAGSLPDGAPLPADPDSDGDGLVSFSEAHAFARIHDGTLDVPVSSSEFFVRTEWQTLDTLDARLTLASPFADILAKAQPVERSVLRSLADDLSLKKDPAAAAKARLEADRLARQRELLGVRADEEQKQMIEARTAIRARLLERWPWLVNTYHPLTADILQKEEPTILELLRNAPEREDFEAHRRTWGQLQRRISDVDVRWARWERLARASERVVMEAQLRELGTELQRNELDRILACESDSL